MQCYHCNSPVPENGSFSFSHNQKTLHFCCPACLAVSEFILTQGLDDYYKKRVGFNSMPEHHDFTVWDKMSAQSEFVEAQGQQATARFYIEGMHCTACAWLIEHHLVLNSAITSAKINYQHQRLTVTFKQGKLAISDIMQLIADVGYHPHPYQHDQVIAAQKKQHQQQLKRIGITALLMMQLGMLAAGVYAGDYLGISAEYRQLLHAFSLLFSLPLLYFSALPFMSSAIVALKHRTFNMDVNIALAIIGLYMGSVVSVLQGNGDVYFDSIAMLCLFILLARFIEFSSRRKLFQSTGVLPYSVNKYVAGELRSVLLNEVEKGDCILIKPGETIAFDAIVTDGESTVSEAIINGESKAIVKKIDDRVFAGSINHDGQLRVCVEHLSSQSLISKIETLTDTISTTPEDKQDDKFSALFTAVISILAVITYIVWHWVEADQAFWVALSVLVISCPCALSLAAPTARSVVQYCLRQQGILIKNAAVLDRVNKVSQVFFDKTGTLTEGNLSLISIDNRSILDEQQLLSIAAALESFSVHPIAKAFNRQKHPIASEIKLSPMQGIEGVIGQTRYRIGSGEYCREWHTDLPLKKTMNQWVGLCTNDKFLCWFELKDSIRNDALETIRLLKKRQLIMEIISGDTSSSVDEMSTLLKIPAYKGCSSNEKFNKIKQQQDEGHLSMMVGEGINDAPGLALSHIAVTLDNASDWVKNQTDVVLLKNELNGIDTLFNQAKAYKRIHHQNIIWALGYNAVAIPIAMMGFISPLFAALGMSLSSIIVVLNSRRLRT